MIKQNLENIIKELDKALAENSELIYTNDFQLENRQWDNALQHESKTLEQRHKKLYDMLIIAKKLLKGME